MSARRALRYVLASHPRATGALLLAVACATRLALVETARFTGDEIWLWETSLRIAQGRGYRLLGPAVTGGAACLPGPLIHYLMAPPLFFTRAPEACNAFTAILGGVSVVIYWSALRPRFGEAGALLAALLMACMPWSTLYGDRIWNPNAVGVFVALAFWAACRLRRRPSLGGVALLCAACAATFQLHLSAPMVWLALIPIFLPSVRRWRGRWVSIACVAVLALYLPMIASEIRSNGANVRALLNEGSAGASTDFTRVPLWALRLLTLDVSYHQLHGYWDLPSEGEMLSFLVNGNGDFRYGPVRAALLGLSLAFALVALGVAGFRLWRGSSSRNSCFLWAALVGVAANTVLLGLLHKNVEGHYVQSLLPFYFVAFAELGRAAMRWRAWWAVYGAALVVCAGGVDVAVWVSSRLDARNGLGTMRHVVAAIARDQPDATSASLSFGFSGWEHGFDVVAHLDPRSHLSFGKPGTAYRLVLRDAERPAGSRLVAETGPVALYRLHAVSGSP